MVRTEPDIPAGKAATDASMNNRQSLLDSMNAGRQRRASSLDQLNRSLEELESRIRRPHDEPETGMEARRSRLAAEAAYYEPPHRERGTAQRMPAHDFERARAQVEALQALNLPGAALPRSEEF